MQKGTASRVLAIAKDLSVSGESGSREQTPAYRNMVAEMKTDGYPFFQVSYAVLGADHMPSPCSSGGPCHVKQLGRTALAS